jgi:hypothetical protein
LTLTAACSNDERVRDVARSDTQASEPGEKAPPPIVKQWYPSPVRAPPQMVLVPAAPSRVQQPVPAQPATGAYYQPAPVQQPQVVMQPAYSYPQQSQQIPQTVAPWGQWAQPVPQTQLQMQGTPQGQQYQQYQVVPQYQNIPRPWGEITYGYQQQNNSAATQQQGVVVPYGSWPSSGAATPAWGGTATYGVNPGLGFPGYFW